MDKEFIEESIEYIENILDEIENQEDAIRDHLDSIYRCVDGINDILKDLKRVILDEDEDEDEIVEEPKECSVEQRLKEVLIGFENYLHSIINEDKD